MCLIFSLSVCLTFLLSANTDYTKYIWQLVGLRIWKMEETNRKTC